MDSLLRQILASYPAAASPLGELEPLGNAGGLSGARLWRYRSGRGRLVLRAWPEGGPGRGRVERIHGRLRRAGGLPFVPVPLADRQGRTVIEAAGRHWELAPWLPGSAERSRPPAPARVAAALAGLAQLHGVFEDEFGCGTSPGMAARRDEVEGLLRGGFDRLEAIIRGAEDDPAAPAALRWIARARGLAPGLRDELRREAAGVTRLQPCLRDARPEHFLFEGERLTGLVDYGAMGVECVAADLARLLLDWLDNPRDWERALAAYRAVRPIGPDEAGLIGAFARSAAVLGGGRWVRWHFAEGRRFERPGAAMEGIARGLERMERLAPLGLIR